MRRALLLSASQRGQVVAALNAHLPAQPHAAGARGGPVLLRALGQAPLGGPGGAHVFMSELLESKARGGMASCAQASTSAAKPGPDA